MGWQLLIGIAVASVFVWATFVAVLFFAGTRGAPVKDAVRIAPDLVRLFRRLAADRSISRGVRIRLWLLLGYLALPIDLVPDFLPIIGYADDAIIAVLVLRSVVRRAGPEAVRRHWPGTEAGLATLARVVRLPE